MKSSDKMNPLKFKLIIHGLIPSKKNSKEIRKNRKTQKSYITSSDAFQQWHLQHMALLGPKCAGIHISPVSRIELKFSFDSRRKADLTNKAEGVMDLLVALKVIKDDDWITVPEVRMTGEYSKENPGCHVFIYG